MENNTVLEMNSPIDQYANKLKTSLYWWLSYDRPFFINNDYKLELLHIDRNHNSVKIRITNLKTQEIVEQDMNEVE